MVDSTILRWKRNPNQFVTETLGATPETWQAEALQALADRRRVSIRSGHGVGKSTLDSWAILWFMSTHYPCKVPCSAPTLHQIKDVLWAELGTWWRKMPDGLQNQFNLRSSDQDMRFYLKDAPDESFAVGRTGRKDNPEALQGFHSPNILFILDEASGIDDVLFEVAGGALSTEDAYLLLTSNPTRTSGYFYDTHHKMRHRFHCMKVACEDSSQVSQRYIEDSKLEYGEESNVYLVRVMGEFPRADDDTIIPLDMVEAAVQRDVAAVRQLPVWGVDVARFGNCRTALAKRKGNILMEPVKSWAMRDLMEVAGLIMHEYSETPSDEMPHEILVDSVGLGAGVVDRCRELRLPVRGVNVGETASGKDRFTNLKAELWWRTREWFDARDCHIPDDSRLIGQLVEVKYKFTSSGKIQIETKEEIMKRKGGDRSSPDEADAFVLTMAGGTRRLQEDRYAMAQRRQRRRSPMSR